MRFFSLFSREKNLVGLSKEQNGTSSRRFVGFKPGIPTDKEWVFSFDGRLGPSFPVIFPEAYADQNFCAFIQTKEIGAPALLFRQQVDPNRIQPTAKLKGKVFSLKPGELEALDMVLGNKVQSYRKRTRILLPFHKDNGVMVNVPAWIYQDNPQHWKEAFSYDFSMFRGRDNGYFTPAALDYNPRFPHVEKYYVHPWDVRTRGLEEERTNAARRAQQNNKPTSTLS
jgi:gamma-glutamylcyclotransferase (GGCT)/AIG2-like uncharacterized protein YtfP